MKLATENLKIEGLNKGDVVDFSGVESAEELKKKLIHNYVLLCRKCTSESFCGFRDASEPPCPMIEKVVHNYIDMNIKSVDTENQYALAKFIESVIHLTRVFYHFENWLGIYVDEEFNWYFESVHPRINSLYSCDLLVEISKFVKAYRVVKIDRVKRFIVFVEGDSEFASLPPIFSALGVWEADTGGKGPVGFINLEGKDSIQRDKIRTYLSRLIEDDVSYFLILDNDPDVGRYVEDLKREGLMEDNRYIIWENKFEDNFGEEAILKVLKEEDVEVFGQIDLDELKEYNSTKNDIGKAVEHLLTKKGIDVNFRGFKVRIARRLSEWICQELEDSQRTDTGSVDHGRTPKSETFPDFIDTLRGISEEIKRIRSEFHVIRS